jgi:uroporphyrin-III C-methyltransferase
MGKLILVGAGPGDPELITVKGLNAVKKADVILYDALIDTDILLHAKKEALKVFSGKRGYEKNMTQEKISKMCVEYARENNIVVRLKGGDPFIFGRGNEEVTYATRHGIVCEVIPGLSSCTSLATIKGVPLTLREETRGFAVVSAVDTGGKMTGEIRDAALSNMTTVVLMGLKRLKEICAMYREIGKGDIAVMVIQNGTMKNEKCAYGTINTIEQVVREKLFGPPAIMIIGNVINYKFENGGNSVQ